MPADLSAMPAPSDPTDGERPMGMAAGSPSRRHAVHICLGFDPRAWAEKRPRADRRAEGCAGHAPCPSGYTQWHEWAEWINKTHRNVACSGCGKFAIWVPRRNKAALAFLAEVRGRG